MASSEIRSGVAQSLRANPILAIITMQIATQHAKAERIRARQKVEEGLLFNWIALQGCDISPWHAQFSPLIETHLADSAAAWADETTMPTGVAAHSPIGHCFVQIPRDRHPIEQF